MSSFSHVVPEEKTLELIHDGKSIARYGDGEFNLVRGRKCVPQLFDKACMAELKMILKADNPKCLVGIPYIPDSMPKKRRKSWLTWLPSYEKHLRADKTYYSAFITRPDSAPNINNASYFARVGELWKGQPVALVFGGTRSLTPEFLMATGARSVDAILCSYEDTYSQIDYLVKMARESTASRVILCAGPTATCMAHRLSLQGKHAIDLGHIGMFWPDTDILKNLVKRSADIKANGDIAQLENGYWWPVEKGDIVRQLQAEVDVAESLGGGEHVLVRNAGTGTMVDLLALKYERVYAVEQHPGKFGSLRRNVQAANVFIYPEDIVRYLPPNIEVCEGVR